jgi:hypothetical protein
MKRAILVATMMALSLGRLGTVYVWAYNCGDTWRAESPDTFGGKCPGSAGFSQINKTAHWKVFRVDGYERGGISVTDYGECAGGIFYSTRSKTSRMLKLGVGLGMSFFCQQSRCGNCESFGEPPAGL